MQALGHEEFLLVGHDRGARVSHRLTKDHSRRVLKLMTLDIIPTHKMFQIVNKDMATSTYHWFFLIQPYDFPERVIGADADYFLRTRFQRGPGTETAFTDEAVDEYARCFRDPAAIHATCEDYRAGASIDLVHDDADFDNKVTCPMMALWSATGYVGPHPGRAGGLAGIRHQRAGPVSALRPLHPRGTTQTKATPSSNRSCRNSELTAEATHSTAGFRSIFSVPLCSLR